MLEDGVTALACTIAAEAVLVVLYVAVCVERTRTGTAFCSCHTPLQWFL